MSAEKDDKRRRHGGTDATLSKQRQPSQQRVPSSRQCAGQLLTEQFGNENIVVLARKLFDVTYDSHHIGIAFQGGTRGESKRTQVSAKKNKNRRDKLSSTEWQRVASSPSPEVQSSSRADSSPSTATTLSDMLLRAVDTCHLQYHHRHHSPPLVVEVC